MMELNTKDKNQEIHKETIDGTTYEVVSHYDESTSLIDLLKWMLKRDMERAFS